MPTLDHVNLCVPETGADPEAEWLVTMLGYRRVEPGPEGEPSHSVTRPRISARWFEADDGTQVHLTVDANHQPSAAAHTAIRLGDALDPTITRLEAAGHRCNTVAFDGDRHVFTNDPAGNLWELIGPVAQA